MNIKTILLALLLGGTVLPVWTGTQALATQDMQNMQGMEGMKNTQGMPMSEGVIRKVDKTSGKITIRHGELYKLGMPAMTMSFRVGNPAMLDQVKPGDSVRFVADRVKGALTITHLERTTP